MVGSASLLILWDSFTFVRDLHTNADPSLHIREELCEFMLDMTGLTSQTTVL